MGPATESKVDDYLTEREQVDRIRQWWKENGAWIIVGVGGGVLALAGWNWWQGYQLQRAEQASAIYAVVSEAAMEERIDEIRVGVERLESAHGGSPYLQHGRLALAGALARAGEFAPAADQLQQVLDGAEDPQLRLIARLRLARVLLASGEEQRALDVARGGEPGVFAAPLREVEGDILAAQGDSAGARAAYESALESTTEYPGIVDETNVRLKLEALGNVAATGSDAS
jgi:predicted negative regulator of RcsB-dependent stress response